MWENCMCFCLLCLLVCLDFFSSIHESHMGSVAFFFTRYLGHKSFTFEGSFVTNFDIFTHTQWASEGIRAKSKHAIHSPTHSLQVILYSILLQPHSDHLPHMRSSVECSIQSDMSALRSWGIWSTLDPNIKDAVNWALIDTRLWLLSLKNSFHCLLPGYLLAPASEGRQDLKAKLHTWEVLMLCPNFV